MRIGQEDVVMSSHEPYSQDDEHHDDHSVVPGDAALRVKALESLLVEKGLVDPATLDAIVDYYEHKVAPGTAPAWSRAPGPILPIKAAF
jgi:hypothetical protein